MNWLLMAKIFQLCVANLGNSRAISGDLRLDLKNFFPPLTQPRINQRLLSLNGNSGYCLGGSSNFLRKADLASSMTASAFSLACLEIC